MRRLLTILGAAIVLRVVAGIVANYPGYLPTPDFHTDFLAGREETFDKGGYRTAFVAHILAGPPTLLLGLLLAVPALRQRAPHWHARLGRLVVALALLVVAPSGLVMARHPLPSLPVPEQAVPRRARALDDAPSRPARLGGGPASHWGGNVAVAPRRSLELCGERLGQLAPAAGRRRGLASRRAPQNDHGRSNEPGGVSASGVISDRRTSSGRLSM